jgi:hypothetical protein
MRLFRHLQHWLTGGGRMVKREYFPSNDIVIYCSSPVDST